MVYKYLLFWIPLPPAAIANGMLRASVYGRYMDETTAHQISSMVLMAIVGGYLWLLGRRWPLRSSGQAVTVGLCWLALTVAFEFCFGYFVMRHPLSALLQDYNLQAGRVWVLVLIWIAAAPWFLYKQRQ